MQRANLWLVTASTIKLKVLILLTFHSLKNVLHKFWTRFYLSTAFVQIGDKRVQKIVPVQKIVHRYLISRQALQVPYFGIYSRIYGTYNNFYPTFWSRTLEVNLSGRYCTSDFQLHPYTLPFATSMTSSNEEEQLWIESTFISLPLKKYLNSILTIISLSSHNLMKLITTELVLQNECS